MITEVAPCRGIQGDPGASSPRGIFRQYAYLVLTFDVMPIIVPL